MRLILGFAIVTIALGLAIPAVLADSHDSVSVSLDESTYTWTDKVRITVNAPSFNLNSGVNDEIGVTDENPIRVYTREGDTLENYKLVETGADTGIFSGEVILTGFAHDADGDDADDLQTLAPRGQGPTDGRLSASNEDGITVSFEYSEDMYKLASAVIEWNVGESQWLDTSYPADGSGTIHITDPDMNWDPEAIDSFNVNVHSTNDPTGISTPVTETQVASGIFEANVNFVTNGVSSGNRLRVAGGDTVTVTYNDNTLPEPDLPSSERGILATVAIDTESSPPDPTDGVTPNAGSISVDLDKATYTWTDKVRITVAAPGFNFDSGAIDEIGGTAENPVRISTREGGSLDNYKLVETGVDTGTFSGEVTLTGFTHDADGDRTDDLQMTSPRGTGPTDGRLPAGDADNITVSFEYAADAHEFGSAPIKWNVGDAQWLETNYPADGSGTVRIVDPDMNWDPDAIDRFVVSITSDTDSYGLRTSVTETQVASGIFEVVVRFVTDDVSEDNRLRVAEGDIVTARYEDNTLPDPHQRHDELDIRATVLIGADPPPSDTPPSDTPPSDPPVVADTDTGSVSVDLDQETYTWTDKVLIKVTAADFNLDSNRPDRIGETAENPVRVYTGEGSSLDNYRLVETGDNTGIFAGEVTLTGFTYDADGDTDTGTGGNDLVTREAGGTGPTRGTLPAHATDSINVSFKFNDNESTTSTVPIKWNVGEVQWLESTHSTAGSGKVRITDSDMNWDLGAKDSFDVNVSSDSDSDGITLTVTETQDASGIFEGTVRFTDSASSDGRLEVTKDDTVTALYEDNTLPTPKRPGDKRDISATMLITTTATPPASSDDPDDTDAPALPLERVVLSDVALTDTSGNALTQAMMGQLVSITGQVTSSVDGEQDYAYLVQISDPRDATLFLTWSSGTLYKDQSVTSAVSWAPTAPGSYTAVIFVWESISKPSPLSPPIVLPFMVR